MYQRQYFTAIQHDYIAATPSERATDQAARPTKAWPIAGAAGQ